MFFVSSLLSSEKSESRRTKKFLSKGRVGPSRTGEAKGKGLKRVNMVQKMCTHVCK
jgi:hypothetical protein